MSANVVYIRRRTADGRGIETIARESRSADEIPPLDQALIAEATRARPVRLAPLRRREGPATVAAQWLGSIALGCAGMMLLLSVLADLLGGEREEPQQPLPAAPAIACNQAAGLCR